MADLDTLRPEVREAVAAIDKGNGVFVNGDDCGGGIAWATVRADLLRLVRDNDVLRSKCNVIMSGSTRHLGRAERAEAELAAALKANRDCVDHFEQMQAELAALKARIADAPRGIAHKSLAPSTVIVSELDDDPSDFSNVSVRLVVEE